jgi:hypothetical protein
MTTSIIQLKANQNNAKKSTGAKTAAGKSIVAKNALKHSVFAKQLTQARQRPLVLEIAKAIRNKRAVLQNGRTGKISNHAG